MQRNGRESDYRSDGLPYEGAKAYYILDIENFDLVRSVIEILLAVMPIPKRKNKWKVANDYLTQTKSI